MLYCSLCDWRHLSDISSDIFCVCLDCFDSFELTETSIRKALENLTKDNVDVAPDNLFHEPDLIKVKAVAHKNGNGNGKHTREITEQIVEVFDYWKEMTDHPDAQLSGERASVISKHLMGTGKTPVRSKDELKRALYGYSIEPIEANGKRYDDITLLLRDAKHIEIGVEIAKRSQSQRRNLSSATDGAEQYSDILKQIRSRRR